jgi:ribosome-binding ATPase YchF (GTP1/OBG family)
MKIAYKGLDLPEGKIKYRDEIFTKLVEKFQPAKVTPFYFELLAEDYNKANGIAVADESVLDLLIDDIEKIENRLSRAEEEREKTILEKCLAHLESEKPICDLDLDSDERAYLNALAPTSFKPTLVSKETAMDASDLCRDLMEKAGLMFYYTAGKQEVHAWLVEKGATAVECAGRIHSDLARGFIKAEIVSCDDMMNAHSMNDARSKGYTKLVDRDYVIPENTVLEIRFNV